MMRAVLQIDVEKVAKLVDDSLGIGVDEGGLIDITELAKLLFSAFAGTLQIVANGVHGNTHSGDDVGNVL